MRSFILVASALLVLSQPGIAQHSHESAGSTPAAHELTALQPFERGLYLLHNFEYGRAIAAFREAQARNPNSVMAYWGEAMADNHPLWMEVDEQKARTALARLGPTPAARLAKARTARERGFLEAVEALYGPGSKIERDRAYNRRMQAMFDADPNDIDVRTFTALSIMGLAHDGRDIPLYMRAAALLEEALPKHPRHPGVLHYLIHAYDDPAHAPLGLRNALVYGDVAPDTGHALHMTSHIYLALGRWTDVERANQLAMRTVNGQRAAAGRPPTDCGHYREWHVYALLQQKKESSAIVDGCRREGAAEVARFSGARLLGPNRSPFNSWADMAARVAVETGRAPPPATLRPENFLRGRFWLAYADLIAAGHDAARVDAAASAMATLRDRIVAAIKAEEPNDASSPRWLDRAVAQAEAISALAHGKTELGLAKLRDGAAAERALPVEYGPPALPKPSDELLGETLLSLGRKAEASEAFRLALAAAPGRRRSIEGLKLAEAR